MVMMKLQKIPGFSADILLLPNHRNIGCIVYIMTNSCQISHNALHHQDCFAVSTKKNESNWMCCIISKHTITLPLQAGRLLTFLLSKKLRSKAAAFK